QLSWSIDGRSARPVEPRRLEDEPRGAARPPAARAARCVPCLDLRRVDRALRRRGLMLAVARDGPVLRVALARPDRRNAFDAALIARLHETFADVGDARVVVVTGEGPSFCAGADVEWQRASIDLSLEENVADAARLYRMLAAVNDCPAPVIAGVHGYALGGGSGLAACADVVVAAADAIFGFTEVRLGIAPAVISPFALAKVGAHARRYFTTGERFDARTAM